MSRIRQGLVGEGDVIQGPWKNPVATQKTNAAELASQFLSSQYAPHDLENEDIEEVAEDIVEFLLKYHEELTDNMDIDDIDTLAKRISREAFVQADLLDEALEENLNKWFKEKWVRFGPDGKIRGACARGSDSEGKPKCLPQSKAHSLGKKGRKYAASKKRREDPNPERTGKAKNVATKKKTNEEQLDELKCWSGYTRVQGVPAGAPGSCKKKTNEEASEKCPHCGGELVSEEMMNEKQDACYRKVKSRYKVWPSAYASGALVQCRKKGASNWGTGGKKKNESSIMKGIVGESASLRGVRVAPKTLDTLYQVRAYDREVSDLNKAKAAEKAKAQAARAKERGTQAAPQIMIASTGVPLRAIDNWIKNKETGTDFIINRYAGRQSSEFQSELANDPEFQDLVTDFFNIAASKKDNEKVTSYYNRTYRRRPTQDEKADEFNAVDKLIKFVLGYMRKYGVDKTGRRVPPNFKYNNESIEEEWTHEYSSGNTSHWSGSVNTGKYTHNGQVVAIYNGFEHPSTGRQSHIKVKFLPTGKVRQFSNTRSGFKEAENWIMSDWRLQGSAADQTGNMFEALRPEQKALKIKKIASDIIAYIGDDPSDSAILDAAEYEAKLNKLDPFELFDAVYDHFREQTLEASSPAQQAAIAINMKKKGRKPKNDVQEDYTGMYAAEKTPKINPYGGRPDRQFRGAISEISDTQTTADQTGGIITPEYDDAYATLKRAAPKLYQYIRYDAPVPLDPILTLKALRQMQGNEEAVLRMLKRGLARDTLAMYGDKHPDAMAESMNRFWKKVLTEMPNTSGPIGTQPGGLRTYRSKPAGEIEEDTAYGGGMGQGGNAGQSYRKFTPKMAGVVKKESSIMKGLRKEGR